MLLKPNWIKIVAIVEYFIYIAVVRRIDKGSDISILLKTKGGFQ